jgi:D-xylulose kinase
MTELIAAIDVGTTGARTIIFDINGKLIGSTYREYPLIHPNPTWVEQDANLWWDVVCNNTNEVLKLKNIDAKNILAVVVTNQRETIVPVDDFGDPLYNALVWQDRRSVKECEDIKNLIGSNKIFNLTGLTIDPYFSASKLLWLKTNKPEIYKKASKFLLVHDFIVHKLTDEFVTDFSNASRTMLFDITRFSWSELICEGLDIPIDKLPATGQSGEHIGEITTNAAAQTGLLAGTQVYAGGGDQQCAAVGLGVINEGLVKATTGTGSFVIAHLNKPAFDEQHRVLCSASVLPESWVLEASIFTTGAVYKWYRDNLAEPERKTATKQGIDVYEILNKKIENVIPGANGLILLPHFMGAGTPYWNPDAKGVLFGLTLAHSKEDILRAIIEGICFEIRKSIEVFAELGLDVKELHIAGGITRSDVINQLQTNIFGIPVIKTAYEETTALGAAIIGAIGSGIYKTYNEAVNGMMDIKKKYLPKNKTKILYDELFLKNKDLFRILSNNNFY